MMPGRSPARMAHAVAPMGVVLPRRRLFRQSYRGPVKIVYDSRKHESAHATSADARRNWGPREVKAVVTLIARP